MNRFWMLACTTLALGGATALSQDSRHPDRADLPQDQAQAEKPADPRQEKPIRGWIRQLGSTEFKEREEAREKLLGAGKEALPLLEAATKDSDDPEIRWQARKLTREIGRGKSQSGSQKGETLRKDDLDQQVPQPVPQPVPQGPRRMRPGSPLDERFDELFQQLERDFGMRIPRGRFFDDEFFKDLERQMQDLRGPGMDRFQGQGRGFSMQVAPDKVRIEIREKDSDGKDKNDVYEAPDLKTFREKYPEIARKYLQGADGQGGMGFQFMDPLGGNRGFRMLDPNGRLRVRTKGGYRVLEPDTQGHGEEEPAPPAAEPIPEGERLGVHIKSELSPELREFLGLDENQGLQVVEVLNGELGEALGVKAGDILAEINDSKIVGTEPIRTALKGLADDGKVRLQVFRKGEKLLLEGKKSQRVK